MLNISDELKLIYKNDQFPYLDSVVPKELIIYFPELDLTIETDQIVDDSFSLGESLCSTDEITLGACEAAKIKFTLADVNQDLTGKEFTITQTVNEIYSMPLGTYKVDSCKKQNDRWFREIIAYDSMKKTDVDVSEWYNGLTFPISVKDMRESLLIYLGIVYESQDLTNDDVMLEKTVEPSYLLGRDVLKCLCELTGGFGHITRENKFKVVQLSDMGLYPSETLYPAEDLFPAESREFLTAGYKNIDYEEYIVEAITGIQIRQDDEDEGVVVGSGDNTYTITGNFLLYGKSAEELETIAHNILLQVANKFYRPHTTQLIGLPYMEVGDTITIITSNDVIETFIFQRTLTGIQALQDEYVATGSQKRENKLGLSTQIEQLKGKALRIQKDVEGVMVSVNDLDMQLTAEMNVLAGQVVLKVDSNGNIGYIDLLGDPDDGLTSIKLKADNIKMEGLVTANARFKILADGSMEAVNGKFSGKITGGSMNINNRFKVDSNGYLTATGASFSDGTITSTGTSGTLKIDGAEITGMNSGGSLVLWITAKGTVNAGTVTAQDMYCNKLNNGTPLTTDNINNYTVGYANNANYANYANIANYADSLSYDLYTDEIYASDTGYGNIDFRGFDNAAGVNWVQANFAPKSSSDIRLKYSLFPLDLPDDLFYELKPYRFKYKTGTYGSGIHFGLIAQQVESAFEKYGLNPYDYDLIELKDVKRYTDDGMYIKDETHRLNYINIIAWLISITQKQNERIKNLENIIK